MAKHLWVSRIYEEVGRLATRCNWISFLPKLFFFRCNALTVGSTTSILPPNVTTLATQWELSAIWKPTVVKSQINATNVTMCSTSVAPPYCSSTSTATTVIVFRYFYCHHSSAGTLQSNNCRLIGCLISFTRLAVFNHSQYIRSAGKARI